MILAEPNKYLEDQPCLVVAVYCATGLLESLHGYPKLKNDGYATLDSANRWIRQNLKVKKRIDYKRGSRPRLKDLHLDGKAIVLVLGHYVYVDHETYLSFFDCENTEVVTTWILKEEN